MSIWSGRAAALPSVESIPANQPPFGLHSGMAIGASERACCCSASPLYRVVLPPSAARAHKTDLLMCGHHYRASARKLKASGAVVFNTSGSLVAG
ncbi:MAG TPA: hypothetical protein VFP34_14930 [Microlunatus sp.]|nr:hypothetical protein [Microlunatus sp.]